MGCPCRENHGRTTNPPLYWPCRPRSEIPTNTWPGLQCPVHSQIPHPSHYSRSPHPCRLGHVWFHWPLHPCLVPCWSQNWSRELKQRTNYPSTRRRFLLHQHYFRGRCLTIGSFHLTGAPHRQGPPEDSDAESSRPQAGGDYGVPKDRRSISTTSWLIGDSSKCAPLPTTASGKFLSYLGYPSPFPTDIVDGFSTLRKQIIWVLG